MHAKSLVATAQPIAAPLNPADLLDEREVAAALNVALNTLRNWRWKGEGPRFVKIGKRAVRYRRSDVYAFIEGDATGKAA